jgi:hypothetical protein
MCASQAYTILKDRNFLFYFCFVLLTYYCISIVVHNFGLYEALSLYNVKHLTSRSLNSCHVVFELFGSIYRGHIQFQTILSMVDRKQLGGGIMEK